MGQCTIVSIYEVDETQATGGWAGQGSLVAPNVVLVHPPLSRRIAEEKGPIRLRVGIVPGEDPRTSSSFAEVIDVEGKPYVPWREDPTTDQVIVALELRTPAQSPEYEIPGLDSECSPEDNFRVAAEHVKQLSQRDWRHPEWSEPEPEPEPLERKPEPPEPEPEPEPPEFEPEPPEFDLPETAPPPMAPGPGAPTINIACLIHPKFC
jgi:hypothetical protein